jgi:hypothetical protein
VRDILYCFCQEKKLEKNKIFINNELEIAPVAENTSPFESLQELFDFGFDESLANDEL